jgi:predicted HTH domain antitoxin
MDLLRHAEISAGRAAEMLKINRGQLSNIMREYKISPFDETMTVEDLQEEVTQVMKILL